MRRSLLTNSLGLNLSLAFAIGATAVAQPPEAPQAEISNAQLHAKVYLPDAKTGFYRGTRFDWSGVLGSLEYQGHNYYGPWFTKTNPTVRDFIYDGPDITAGPCSAITGPVEEFSTDGQALGYREAQAGGTFIKIGVGALRKPDDEPYSPYRLYDIVNPGEWSVQAHGDSIRFVQSLADAGSGYAYRYTKVVRLVKGKAEMVIEHRLKNTGQRAIQTDVYDHNFLVLDKQPTGPDFSITLPYEIGTKDTNASRLAEVRGRQIVYRQTLQDRDTFAAQFTGFGDTPASYQIKIENSKVGMGMQIKGNRPLSKEGLWSIRSVLAMEPFISMSIEPGAEYTWSYAYSYYALRP